MTADRIVLNEASYHGAGVVREISGEAKIKSYKKTFVCSDPNLTKFGVARRMADVLDEAGLPYEVYSDIEPNPTIKNIQTGVAAFKASDADYIVATGGNSPAGTAKVVDIAITNPELENMGSLEDVAPTKNPCVPIITVPTTAGTVAEVTTNYAITNVEKKRRFTCVDAHDIPIVAVIDSDMMSSMPKRLMASTGMDALAHAVKGYITKGTWEMMDMFHLKAIKLISNSLRGMVDNTPEDCGDMALGQYIAGMGSSNVGLGIVHSMTYSLGIVYDTPHDVANTILLPTVMKYNVLETGDKYEYIARAMSVKDVDDMNQEEYRKATVDVVKKLPADVGVPTDLKVIVKREDVQFLSESAYADAYCPDSPRDTLVEEIKALYKSLI